MAIKNIVRITTNDTKRIYEFPPKKAHPQLWQVELTVRCIHSVSGHVEGTHASPAGIIHVERKTLEDANALPVRDKRKDEDEEPAETVEDLILRLLEHVGYYPCPGDC